MEDNITPLYNELKQLSFREVLNDLRIMQLSEDEISRLIFEILSDYSSIAVDEDTLKLYREHLADSEYEWRGTLHIDRLIKLREELDGIDAQIKLQNGIDPDLSQDVAANHLEDERNRLREKYEIEFALASAAIALISNEPD